MGRGGIAIRHYDFFSAGFKSEVSVKNFMAIKTETTLLNQSRNIFPKFQTAAKSCQILAIEICEFSRIVSGGLPGLFTLI